VVRWRSGGLAPILSDNGPSFVLSKALTASSLGLRLLRRSGQVNIVKALLKAGAKVQYTHTHIHSSLIHIHTYTALERSCNHPTSLCLHLGASSKSSPFRSSSQRPEPVCSVRQPTLYTEGSGELVRDIVD